MTTFEALGDQFNSHRFLYNFLVSLVVIFAVIAGTAFITADIMDNLQTNTATGSSGSTVSAEPIKFPANAGTCLQNCSPVNLQTQTPLVQAQPAILQNSSNVMSY